MLIETQHQSRRAKSYARLFQIAGMLFLVAVMLACSFSVAVPSPAPTQPAPTQPQHKASHLT